MKYVKIRKRLLSDYLQVYLLLYNNIVFPVEIQQSRFLGSP